LKKATQIKTDYPAATAIEGQNGVNKAGPFPLPESRTERKVSHPGRIISITGYKNWKYALRLLNKSAQAQALLFVKGGAVKLKPAKPKPANWKGKKIYTDDRPSASPRHQEKADEDKTGHYQPRLKKNRAALALKGKSLTKSAGLLKHRIPSVPSTLPGNGNRPVLSRLIPTTTADRPLPASISSPSPPPMSPRAEFACIPSSPTLKPLFSPRN
jgi:hypothetical protein